MNRITTAGWDVVVLLGRKFGRAWLVLSCLACLAVPAQATVHTWTGLSPANVNWNSIFNWELFSVPPNNGTADVFFPPRLFPMSTSSRFRDDSGDVAWNIRSLTFNSGPSSGDGWNFSGGSLTVDAITNNHNDEQAFKNEVRTGASLMTIDAAGGDIVFHPFNGGQEGEVFRYASNSTTVSVQGGNSVTFFNGLTGSASFDDLAMSISEGTLVTIGNSSSAVDQFNITDGTLLINSASNLGTDADVSLDSSTSKLDLNGFDVNIRNLTGSGSVVTGGATLTFGRSTNSVFSGVISGAGGVTKDQAGVHQLTGVNTYTGATNITAGTLQLGTGGSLNGATDVSVSAGATFDLNGISDTVDSISGDGTIRLGGATLVVDETAGTRNFSGDIIEAGKLQKDGGGTLFLTGSNSFTTLDINAGEVQVSALANLGSGVIELGSGSLHITLGFTNDRTITANGAGVINVNIGSTFAQNGAISGSGSINKMGGGTLVLGASNSYTGDTTINAGALQLGAANRISNSSDVVLIAGAFNLDNFSETVASLSGTGGTINTGGTFGVLTVNAGAGTFTFAGSVAGTGGLNKQGGHTLVLTSVNSYSGATNITGGLLQLSGAGRLGDDSDVTITAATWDLNGVSDTVDSIAGSGIILLGGATLTVDEAGSATHTFSGVISETGNLVKSGTHTLVLDDNNSYTGTTTLDAGVLRVANSSNLGSGGLIFDTATLNTTGSFTNSRTAQINATDSATFDVNASTTLTQTGVISGVATTTLIKQGSGTLTLEANNAATFSGAVDVNAGTLNLGTGDVLHDSTSVDLAAGTTLQVTQGEDIGGLTGSGNVSLASGQILRVGLNNLSVSYSGNISGAGGFTKSGSGIFTVSGAPTYTGATRVHAAGTLVMNGVHTGGGDYTVDAGAKLAGNGTISGNVAASGTIAPGTSAGMLTIGGNLTLAAQSKLEIEIGGTLLVQRDFLDVAGNIQLDGTLAVTLINGFNPAAGNAFNILDWGTQDGNFATLQLPALTGSLIWNTSLIYTSGVLSVAVPGLPGDYNNNGKVDAADYVLWRKGGPLANEVDVPGTVNAADYTAWRDRFGNPSGSGSGSAVDSPSQTGVPEPSTLVLLMLAAAGRCLLRRRPT